MTTLTTLSVDGMTCEHCVSAVTRELDAVAGVGRVSVTLRNGGTSTVAVSSAAPLDEAALRDAVDEAGYDVVGVEVLEDALTQTVVSRTEAYKASGHSDDDVASALAEAPTTTLPLAGAPDAEPKSGGCACGCGGHGRQGLGIGLPIVPKD